MESTDYFTRTILSYFEQIAETDALFAEAFAKPEKKAKRVIMNNANQYLKN
ncbi:hypothetical protein [Dysgonomonas mossii]|uniref:hypothetical protein n=1 Tax=Dysgonomonas mossii TaxID=163665 RepID=UPI003993B5FA